MIRVLENLGLLAAVSVLSLAAPMAAKELPDGADPVAFMQGEWISRFEGDDARIAVQGNTIRMVSVGAKTSGTLKFFNAGETIATIGSIKKDGPNPAVTPPLRSVVFNATCTGIQGAERTRYTHDCEVRLTGHPGYTLRSAKPQMGKHYSISIGYVGDFYRVDEKPRIFADYYAYGAGK